MVNSSCAACVAYSGASPTGAVDIDGNGTSDLASVPVIVWNAGTASNNITNAGGILSVAPTGSASVTPAVEYWADSGNHTLRKFSRATGGQSLPISADVADLQVTYSDGSIEYCNGTSTCPMSPFNAAKITWVKINLMTRSREVTRPVSDTSSCRPAVANRLAGNATNECGYEYNRYTATIGLLMNVSR
jgi:hypothetical protein